MTDYTSDILVIAAHPDDAELGCGGTIIDFTSKGYSVSIIDCSEGELGSRGTIEQRYAEAQNADIVMGIKQRFNLQYPDGSLQSHQQISNNIASYIRLIKPKILLFPPAFERHPDHEAVHKMCRTAYFLSGLNKVELYHNDRALEAYRPSRIFSYIQAYHQEPDFIVDISSSFHKKMKAIHCYSSQVYVENNHNTDEPETYISTPAFMQSQIARAQYFGSMIGAEYGEGFLTIDAFGLSSMSILL
jgi:bacillithiol biosynthesis deacetylase BshB1